MWLYMWLNEVNAREMYVNIYNLLILCLYNDKLKIIDLIA